MVSIPSSPTPMLSPCPKAPSGAGGPFAQDVLTVSSSTESEGENGPTAAGQGQATTNDSDDIQTISSGSEDEEGDEKRNPSSGSGEDGGRGGAQRTGTVKTPGAEGTRTGSRGCSCERGASCSMCL